MRVLVVEDERPCLDELVYMLSKQDDVALAKEMLADVRPQRQSGGREHLKAGEGGKIAGDTLPLVGLNKLYIKP